MTSSQELPNSSTEPNSGGQHSGETPELSRCPLRVRPQKIKLLYDGECPLCVREVNFLTEKDAGRGIVKFVDIASLDYDPQENAGIDFATAMGRIHAILPDGTVIKNVEVFRQVYEKLGMGWVYGITKVPVIGAIVDRIYDIWADWRLKLTRRPDLNIVIARRQKKLNSSNSSRCRVD